MSTTRHSRARAVDADADDAKGERPIERERARGRDVRDDARDASREMDSDDARDDDADALGRGSRRHERLTKDDARRPRLSVGDDDAGLNDEIGITCTSATVSRSRTRTRTRWSRRAVARARRERERRVGGGGARASSSESSEEDGEEDGKAMRKRYDEARGAIERALRGEGDSKNVAAKCRACPGTLLLNAGDMREHAKSKKHAKNLKRLGKADDDAFVCFYPAVKEDEGIVSDGEAEAAERLRGSRENLRAAEGERTEGGKFSLDQFDSSDDEDGDGDSDDADDDARDAKMTKRLAKKEFCARRKRASRDGRKQGEAIASSRAEEA